ncbi:hypothetical protein [Thalassotalea sp. ND16A]|uniref:hypothetical protein n=1 Tax=Thalassotalea sp. ND16A TaxID=1535422 RepID=UPI00051A2D7A|nr:hypothetical protein [Thalassotalea sp. ND16A]KGJ98938.1 hypothetical protein ND16A_0460 [Thalassotalea sp. ND16A]
MQKQWFVSSEKFSKLSNREKYIILFAGVFIFYLLFNAIAFETNATKMNKLQRAITQFKNKNITATIASEKAQVRLAKDANKDLDKQIAQFENKLKAIDNELGSLTDELILPDKMRSALQDMLQLSPGVTLLSFKSMAPEPLIRKDLRSAKVLRDRQTPQIDLYRHNFRISLEGSYLQLRDYLQKVEQLPWPFYWHEFDYSVSDYPNGKLNIEMYSLSTKKEFIGV